MQRRLLTLIAITALAVGLAACGSSSKSSTPSGGFGHGAQITIDNVRLHVPPDAGEGRLDGDREERQPIARTPSPQDGAAAST